MREAIKRIVMRLFPEIASGLHLDRYARIVRISDPPADGVKCDRFRPYFAADIEILTADGKKAKGFPIYEAVPLPVPAAGDQAGMFHWPRPGSIVTVRWIEGRPDHPVIQHVYAIGITLPAVPDKMGRWQHSAGVHQTVDTAGNWERKTGGNITDDAATITETTSGDRSEDVGGNSNETVAGNKTTTATAYQVSAGSISISAPGGASLLPEITGAIDSIKAALDALANHTHPSDGAAPSQSAEIATNSTSAGNASTAIKTLQT